MNVNNFWGAIGALIFVALATTIVSSPNTANVTKAIGGSFTDALRAAQGK